MTCQKLISNYTHVIGTHTRYTCPNDVYVTLVYVKGGILVWSTLGPSIITWKGV